MPRALVTGANRGIGLELTRQLTQMGWEVIACCRHRSIDLEELGVRIEALDVASDESIEALASRLGVEKLDLLVNNAGILDNDGLEPLQLDSIRKQFEVNAVGPLHVTAALRPNLHPDSRIVFVTSQMGSIGDNSSGGYYGYRMSKAALNAAAVSVARDLAEEGILVLVVHPGYVRTGMTGGRGTIEAAEAANGILARVAELTPERSGSFVHARGGELPW